MNKLQLKAEWELSHYGNWKKASLFKGGHTLVITEHLDEAEAGSKNRIRGPETCGSRSVVWVSLNLIWALGPKSLNNKFWEIELQ